MKDIFRESQGRIQWIQVIYSKDRAGIELDYAFTITCLPQINLVVLYAEVCKWGRSIQGGDWIPFSRVHQHHILVPRDGIEGFPVESHCPGRGRSSCAKLQHPHTPLRILYLFNSHPFLYVYDSSLISTCERKSCEHLDRSTKTFKIAHLFIGKLWQN